MLSRAGLYQRREMLKMFTRKPVYMLTIAAGVFALNVASIGLAAEAPANPVALGSAITEAQLADWDLIVAPDGHNLPEGSGTAAQDDDEARQRNLQTPTSLGQRPACNGVCNRACKPKEKSCRFKVPW